VAAYLTTEGLPVHSALGTFIDHIGNVLLVIMSWCHDSCSPMGLCINNTLHWLFPQCYLSCCNFSL